MTAIHKQLAMNTTVSKAYRQFIHEINDWWPREYTWSQEKLQEIRIEGKEHGLCTEIGPYGFRCDWGRVTCMVVNELLEMKWQISAKREPVPDPAQASDIRIRFRQDGNSTTLDFEHYNFDNHGDDGEKYREMMNSEYGWDYILDRFRQYCEGI